MAKRTLTEAPQTIKVGYTDYRVESWDHAQADAASMHGETDRIRRIIRVDYSHGGRESAQTLLHELMHAAWGMWEIGNDKTLEEHVVTVLSAAMATIWRDNPDMFQWIGANLAAKEPS